MTGRAPTGRAEVVDALERAAIELFARQGIRSTPVRRIAEEAGVNHGLVHHYFGSKRALLESVLDRLAAAHAGEIGTAEAARMADRHWRILAYALLEGEDPEELQHDFPLFERMVRDRIGSGLGEADARGEAAHAIAAVLGWQMFRRLIVTGTGLDDATRAAVEHRVLGAMAGA